MSDHAGIGHPLPSVYNQTAGHHIVKRLFSLRDPCHDEADEQKSARDDLAEMPACRLPERDPVPLGVNDGDPQRQLSK